MADHYKAVKHNPNLENLYLSWSQKSLVSVFTGQIFACPLSVSEFSHTNLAYVSHLHSFHQTSVTIFLINHVTSHYSIVWLVCDFDQTSVTLFLINLQTGVTLFQVAKRATKKWLARQIGAKRMMNQGRVGQRIL